MIFVFEIVVGAGGRGPWSWWGEAADGGRLVVGAEVGGDATEDPSKVRRGRAPVVVGGLLFVVGLRNTSSTGELSQTYGPGWGLIGGRVLEEE